MSRPKEIKIPEEPMFVFVYEENDLKIRKIKHFYIPQANFTTAEMPVSPNGLIDSAKGAVTYTYYPGANKVCVYEDATGNEQEVRTEPMTVQGMINALGSLIHGEEFNITFYENAKNRAVLKEKMYKDLLKQFKGEIHE